jgi:hypothetical protein
VFFQVCEQYDSKHTTTADDGITYYGPAQHSSDQCYRDELVRVASNSAVVDANILRAVKHARLSPSTSYLSLSTLWGLAQSALGSRVALKRSFFMERVRRLTSEGIIIVTNTNTPLEHVGMAEEPIQVQRAYSRAISEVTSGVDNLAVSPSVGVASDKLQDFTHFPASGLPREVDAIELFEAGEGELLRLLAWTTVSSTSERWSDQGTNGHVFVQKTLVFDSLLRLARQVSETLSISHTQSLALLGRSGTKWSPRLVSLSFCLPWVAQSAIRSNYRRMIHTLRTRRLQGALSFDLQNLLFFFS